MEGGTPASMAIVSGKGGSGKTIVSTVMAATVLDASPVILMDADIGTAGLTYYLASDHVRNIRTGLSDVCTYSADQGPGARVPLSMVQRALQPVKGYDRLWFYGIGDHRKLVRLQDRVDIGSLIAETIDHLSGLGALLVDCRGGIDEDSLAVCRVVDDIALVTEPDITAYQATRHLVDVLSDHDLAHKLRGFFLNKVFQNPSQIRARGTTEFGCQFLAAIPHDIEVMRSFFIGDIPAPSSSFSTHVREGCSRLYPEVVNAPSGRVWAFHEYDRTTISDPDGIRGGNLAAIVILQMFVYQVLLWGIDGSLVGRTEGLQFWLYAITAVFGVAGSSARLRVGLGRAAGKYFELLLGLLSPRRRARRRALR